jgi:hypothetical protein
MSGSQAESNWFVTMSRPSGVSARGTPGGLRNAGLARGARIGGVGPVCGIVAGAVGLELAGGTHDLRAERAQLRRDGLIGEMPVRACRPCTPPAVVTRPIGLLERYGGSRSASRISQSMAFLNAPLTEPWYVGLAQIIASHS